MILLLGNKGLLGTDVEIYLREHNIRYISCDKEIDISNIATLKTFCDNKKFEWIINCSGISDPDKCELNPEVATKVNVDGIQNICEIAKEKDAKLIHISDARIFDGNNNDEYTEFDTPNPETVYGKSKLESEKIIQANLEKYFILRTAWLYGKFGTTFVSTLFKLISKKTSKIEIVDDETGSPTYTKDLVDGIFRIVSLNSTRYGIYNFSNKNKTDWFEFSKEIYRLIMLYETLPRFLQAFVTLEPITSSEYKTTSKRLQNSYLNSRNFENTFNFSIRTWKLALEDFISTLKK
jgi:dTDP-4-dehydrorhamnose reductase